MDDQEKLAEQEALKVPTDEEIRAKVIEDFGFDETDDSERIDKLVAKEKGQREITSKAIAAKIKHRTDAETLQKKLGEMKPPVDDKKDDLPSKDIIYLSKADIDENDVEEVLNYAKKMGVSVKEAHAFYKPILAVRTEERKTAEMTNTSAARRSNSKVSDEELLGKARKGELPESDAEIERLMKAKMAPVKN